jgi:hypothetical protein
MVLAPTTFFHCLITAQQLLSRRMNGIPAGSRESYLRQVRPAHVTMFWQNEDDERLSASAEVQDVIQGGMAVETADAFPIGPTITVQWDMAERRGVVHHCQRRGKRHFIILHFVGREHRREDRLSSGGTGILSWFDGGRQTATVTVKNATKGGVQLEMQQSVPLHQMVRLSGETWECQGQVRYCRRELGKILLGIQFTRPPYLRGVADYRDR